MAHIYTKPTYLTSLYLLCKDTGIYIKANLDSRVCIMILIPLIYKTRKIFNPVTRFYTIFTDVNMDLFSC